MGFYWLEELGYQLFRLRQNRPWLFTASLGVEDHGRFWALLDRSENSSPLIETWFPTSTERRNQDENSLGWDYRRYQEYRPSNLPR